MRRRANFVVEYKSSRRLPKTQPSSIWGNLDLKSVARQLEGDHGIPAGVPAEFIVLPGEETAPASSVKVLAAETARADRLPGRSAVTSEAQSGPIATEQSVPLEQPVTKQRAAGKAAKGMEPKPLARRARGKPQVKRAPPASLQQDVLPDELAVLEAENRQLKLLMIERLRKENSILQSMLARF